MRKQAKVLALLLALVMLVATSSVALASTFNPLSYHYYDQTVVEAPNPGSEFKVDPDVKLVDDLTGEAAKVLGSISFFDAATQAKIKALGNVSTIYELVKFTAGGDFSSGLIRWAFPSGLKGKAVVAVIGIVKNDKVVSWTALPAAIATAADGASKGKTFVQFYIPQDLFKDIKDNSAILAILG
ncbi:hypothetical protein AGMMS49992_05400 [Clostridia bacterium]|nr:hypothetical protein AGMMS49992_05400 [Clostridia bacterium]